MTVGKGGNVFFEEKGRYVVARSARPSMSFIELGVPKRGGLPMGTVEFLGEGHRHTPDSVIAKKRVSLVGTIDSGDEQY